MAVEANKMNSIEPTLLASKFRGILLGALVGDCCGRPYEFQIPNASLTKRDLDKLEGEYFSAPVKRYSDDTAMTRVLASTLLKGYNQKELAKNFTEEYYKDPYRAYGNHVRTVFQKLKENKFADPTGPAKEQFGGAGSFGNGGAMRISPMVLYCWNNFEKMTRLVKEATVVTHTVSFLLQYFLKEKSTPSHQLLCIELGRQKIHCFCNLL